VSCDPLFFAPPPAASSPDRPPIEPAVSARQFVERLPTEQRTRFLAGGDLRGQLPPTDAAARIDALVSALESNADDSRRQYLRDILTRERADRSGWRAFLHEQYI